MIAALDNLSLFPRQEWSRHLAFEAWKAGHRIVVLVMPTGGGKRYLALWFCQFSEQHARRVLFLTNRRLLIVQTFRDAEKFGIGHGVIMADTDPGDIGAATQMATHQTLHSWYFRDGLGAQIGEGMPPADLIIIDEGHQDTERYRQLLTFYPKAKVLVLTATPVGSEGRSLIPDPYDVLVEGCKNSELIADGLLLPTKVYAPSEPNIEGVKIVKRQEYNQTQLGKAVKECTVFADVFNEWSAFADRKTVCFVPGVAFGNDLVRQFNAHLGVEQAHMISAKTSHVDRERILDDVREGRAKVLVSVDVLREGFDLPELSCAIDLQPNQQLRTYWQKIGRIKRAHEGQTEAIYLDFAGNYWRFPHPDTDPEWPVGDETTQDVIKRQRKSKATGQPIMCPKCSFVRERGPKCPQCGHTADGDPIRRVRMGNGKLKNVPAIAKEKREKSDAEKLRDKWKGCLFAGLMGNRTFAQCEMMFKQSTDQYPQKGWPGVSEPGSLDRKRKVGQVFDKRSLAITFSKLGR